MSKVGLRCIEIGSEYKRLFIFVLKATNKIYAFTGKKSFAKEFRSQRNMKLFKEILIEDKISLELVASCELVHEAFSDEKDENLRYVIALTIRESIALDNCIDAFISHFETLDEHYLIDVSDDTMEAMLKKSDINPNTYYDTITKLTSIISKEELEFNQIKLFYKMFEYTFKDVEVTDPDDYLLVLKDSKLKEL